MHTIQELFDPSKKLNRAIESVVTFGATTEQDLSSEIKEYVVTRKLHDNYNSVLIDLQEAFNNSSNEIGVWVSGFYGSGKSSFAKYLGLSFDRSLMIDGVTFGSKLMSRINDTTITAMHNSIISVHNPLVVMIDLSTQAVAGKVATVSDIVYYETIKLLGITKSTDQKVMSFVNLLYSEGKYDEFCQLVEAEKGKKWEEIETNDLAATLVAANMAPRVLPAYFPDSASFQNITLNSAINEKERFAQLYKLVKEKTGKDKIIFVLDEVGQYVASNVELILNLQGMIQIFKDEFRGNVWVIATAQQTLTEDNRDAQLNSNELFRLAARFPVKVDIEANDIKEIITKRLLGKSTEGHTYLTKLFSKNESVIKNNTHLVLQQNSIYNQVLTDETFANLYPFLPVHIDILLSLLQKLASRTGGVGLRSVIRLIRDILVDNHLADATIGQLAGPEHFYDVLHPDMERNATKEIVIAADKAIQMFNGDTLAVRICKTVAILQLLDDFNLTFDNLCALLYNNVDSTIDKSKVRTCLEEIMQSDGVTLQEVDGKYQFMTNAILGIREERNRYLPRESEKAEVLQGVLKDILSPAPSVNVYQNKTIVAGVDLTERTHAYPIHTANTLKMNVRFVDGAAYAESHQQLLTESTRRENARTLYWLCTLPKDKEAVLQEIVRCQSIKNRHQNETDKEIQAYLRAQTDTADEKTRQLRQLLMDAMNNSEIIFRGTPQQVNGTTYKTVALKTIAEKVFEKYPLASCSMKGNCVSSLAAYSDLSTLPPSLNPLNIINKTAGIIDTTHPALAEIKDFIAQRNELAGQELLAHFEQDPYGWSKDTVRYLVALMLKASMIQIRVNGKDVTVFGESAVAAMDSNNSFNKINISLNTNGELTTQELLEATKNLTGIFNSPRTAPLKDRIADEALKKIKYYLPQFRNLLDSFNCLHLAGLPLLQQAIGYSDRIINSEGGDAACLLGKDAECVKVLKYAMDVQKCNKQSQILDHLKHIDHLNKMVDSLPSLTQLDDLRKHAGDVAQLFNDYTNNPDLVAIASEITDLKNQFDNYIIQACIEFQTQGNDLLNDSREEVRGLPGYAQLTTGQKIDIDARLDGLDIECRSHTIEGLQEMVNTFVGYKMNNVETIKKEVARYVEQNAPAVKVTTTTTATPTPSPTDAEQTATSAHESACKSYRVAFKKQITTRADLQDIINELTRLLDSVDDDSPLIINVND